MKRKQNKLSDNDKQNSVDKQKEINDDFDKTLEDLDQLEKDNKDLKAPVELPKDEATEKSIDEDLRVNLSIIATALTSQIKQRRKSMWHPLSWDP